MKRSTARDVTIICIAVIGGFLLLIAATRCTGGGGYTPDYPVHRWE